MVNFYVVTGFLITLLLFVYSWRLPKNVSNIKHSQTLTSDSSKILSKLKIGKLDHKLFLNIIINELENILSSNVNEYNYSQINNLKNKCSSLSTKDKIDKNAFNKIFVEYKELTTGMNV